MEQNSIDITVKTENLINAVQNEPSIWNTNLNSSAMFTYTSIIQVRSHCSGQVNAREQVFGLASMVDFGENDTTTHARKSLRLVSKQVSSRSRTS